MCPAPKLYLTVVPDDGGGTLADRDLVSGLLAQEPKAAVLTFRKYGPRIFGVVQRAVGPSADAEDLTQDIFMRVFARVHTLRNPDAFGSFVLSVAVRVIKWQLRRRRVRRILQLAEDGQAPEVAIPGLDMEARQALTHLYDILDTLPTEERTVFALRHIEGMELLEIAAAVGVSLATIKRRLQRAVARVREQVRADPALAAYENRMVTHEA